MIIIKSFSDEKQVNSFKQNLSNHLLPLVPSFRNRKRGLYLKFSKNFINIMDVTEEPARGGPICMHFYGFFVKVFKKYFLLGVFCPDFIYTLFTLAVLLIPGEYIVIKIFAFILWLYIYISNAKRISFIRELLKKCK